MVDGPLDGLRILDFTWVFAGPFGVKTLADLGAQVIKIEAPNRPDPFRALKNMYDDIDNPHPDAYFNNFNRNKIGVTLNLKHPKGLELCKRLLAISDVVVENFRGGVMERLGLGYAEMCKIKPDIIYASASGYGHSGPYKDYAAHFHIPQALSGFTTLSGFPGDMPVATGAFADSNQGLYLALAILMALEYRYATGEGQWIDLSMFEAMTSNMDTAFLDYTLNGREGRPLGNRLAHPAAIPHGAYRCKGEDRWCTISVSCEEEWQAFCQALGWPSWTQETRFASITARLQHADELDRLVEAWTQERSAEEVMEILQNAGVPAGVVENAQDLLDKDEHLRARGFYEEAWHPTIGRKKFEGVVAKMSETPGRVRRGAPLLGEFNEFVFGEILGLSAEELKACYAEGVF